MNQSGSHLQTSSRDAVALDNCPTPRQNAAVQDDDIQASGLMRTHGGSVMVNHKQHTFACALATATACGALLAAPAERTGDERVRIMEDASEMKLRIGGCGGVYFLPDPGEFVVEVMKQDRNRRMRANVRAILFGPDRQVLDEVWMPDDGRNLGSGAGPVQTVRLSTVVKHKGVYGLMITSANDRYGNEALWGFRTNCPKYLIETSRGHRDARHEEPLVLANPTVSGDVCFLPRKGAFSVDVHGLHGGSDALSMHNARGDLIETLKVSAKGRASHKFPADVHRDAVPWRLHFPKYRGVVNLDGVTRWTRSDLFRDLSLWTDELTSWFPFHENRWLLTPYSRTVHGKPGSEGTLTFRVHNHALAPKTVSLKIEFPNSGAWPANLSTGALALKPRKAQTIALHYRVPETGDGWTCRLRATADDFSTYSSVFLKRGDAPATRPIPMPLVLKPYRHENEQFGHMPDYPVDYQVYFDRANRPFVAERNAIMAWRNGKWARTALLETRGRPKGASMRMLCSKIAFDADNDVYALARMSGKIALLHSTDHGATFSAYPIPGKGGADIEEFSGHNTPEAPPPFVRFTRTAKDPKLKWRSLNDLSLFLPEKRDGKIVISDPVLISRRCIGLANHSGIPSTIVSRGPKVHVTWGEATDPKKKVPGVPTYVATYDRTTGKLSDPALVGYGPPANDVHNSPSITMDSKGFLHVIVGTHGRPFKYARSLRPNAVDGGWTKAEDVGPGLRQTYVGLVCDQSDTLHLVFRLWRAHESYFPAGSYACLAHMSKRPGKPWSKPRPLVVAAFTDYSVYYHRLTIDRRGRLFLSYDYWSTYWFYRTDRFRQRAVLTSPDGGKTWKLAQGVDLVP